jgi:hypothetical protein
MEPMLTLREVTDANRAAVLSVRISPYQEEYASGVADSLEDAGAAPSWDEARA